MRRIQKRAFTLIELLVVIAIIAILAAILFPVFAQAKVAAKKTVSLSNMKQLGTATNIYLSDSDDVFPVVGIVTAQDTAMVNAAGGCIAPVGWVDRYAACGSDPGWNDTRFPNNWAKQLFPYTKSTALYLNPANVNTGMVNKPNAVGTGYVYNDAASAQSASKSSAPADLVLFQGWGINTREAGAYPDKYGWAPNGRIGADGLFEFGAGEQNVFSGTPMQYNPPGMPLCHDLDVRIMGNSFNGGDSYAFADGHAKFFKRNAISFRNFGWQTVFRENMGFAKSLGETTKLQDLTRKDAGDYWGTFGNCDLASM